MNEGISFDEACALTPEGLTSKQYANCPGVTTGQEWAIYAVVGIVVALIITFTYYWLRKRSNKGS